MAGKRVLIVGGAGGGIGSAITRAIVRAGAAGVAVVARDQHRLTAELEGIGAGPNALVALVADMRSGEQIAEVVDQAVATFGGLDSLVTAVGGTTRYTPLRLAHDFDDEAWDSIFDVNLRYIARLLRAAIPVFRSQGTGGHDCVCGVHGGDVVESCHGALRSRQGRATASCTHGCG